MRKHATMKTSLDHLSAVDHSATYVSIGLSVKILHFFKTYWSDNFGGIERTVHAIATATTKFGIETDVLSLNRTPQDNAVSLDGHFAYKAKLDLNIASAGISGDVSKNSRS